MNLDSPPPSPLNASTEPPEATPLNNLTCPNHARKRQRTAELSRPRKRLMLDSDLDDDIDVSISMPKRKVLKRKQRSHLDSPPASPVSTPTTPTTPPSKSEEALKFESAIARGSWSNVFRSFGPQIVNNRGQMLDGVNIDMFDATGMTALHAAAYVGNEQLALLLLKRGARHQLATLNGWTVWHFAARNYKVLTQMINFLRPKMA